MPKVKLGALHYSERQRITQEFSDLILCLRNKTEMGDVLLGLMTKSEVLMFARRIQIAKELLKGGTQDEIRRKLKVGFDTMRSVENWLHTGNPRRDRWLAKEIIRLNHSPDSDSRRSPMTKLDRYPEHRLMKEILQKLTL